jgi:hypothetical protein
MSILGVAKFAYNIFIIRPCVGCICSILKVTKMGTGCLGFGGGPNKEVDYSPLPWEN